MIERQREKGRRTVPVVREGSSVTSLGFVVNTSISQEVPQGEVGLTDEYHSRPRQKMKHVHQVF